jgi:hypothetical protein
MTKSVLLIISILVALTAHARAASENSSITLAPEIVLHMEKDVFLPEKHKIHTCKVLDWPQQPPCLIDGKPIFGTDWTTPTTTFTRAWLDVMGVTVDLDVSSLYNPWIGSKPNPSLFRLTNVEGGYLLRGQFSDGAGSYTVEWFIIQGASVRTLVSEYDESK